MSEAELIAWYERLSAQQVDVDGTEFSAWIVEAESALAMAFPSAHPVRTSWAATRKRCQGHPHFAKRANPERIALSEFMGIIQSAERQLKQGHVRSLSEGIRLETVIECLDVAESLLAAKHLVAATVIAGGALEVHLRHLCERFSVTIAGHGSIETYNTALAQARNAGKQTIAATDTKQINAWGGRRNDAAHDPVTFSTTATAPEVGLIIEGIRQFLARTA